MTIMLTPGDTTLETLARIYWDGDPAVLPQEADEAVRRSAERIAAIASGNAPVYGVNTGFGKLASIKIDASLPKPVLTP